MPVFAEVIGGVHEHPAGARGRVVDRIAGARLQDAYQGVHHLRGREELARLCAGVVGELLDEVLVGPAQHIGRHTAVRQVVLVEVLDQRVDDFVGDQRLAGPVGRRLIPVHREHAPQLAVRVGHGPHRTRQGLADVHRDRLDVSPPGAVRDGVAMLAALAEDRLLRLGERAALLALLLRDGVVRLPLPLIAEPLVEHQRQDVVLVVLPRGLAAEDVRSAPQVRFELLEGQFHSVACSRAPAPRFTVTMLYSAPPLPEPRQPAAKLRRHQWTALEMGFP